jgi:hypothetical protein
MKRRKRKCGNIIITLAFLSSLVVSLPLITKFEDIVVEKRRRKLNLKMEHKLIFNSKHQPTYKHNKKKEKKHAK